MNDNNIKNVRYIVLSLIIILIFVIVSSIINLNYYLRKSKDKLDTTDNNIVFSLEDSKNTSSNIICLIVTGKDKSDCTEIIEESLEKANIRYISKEKLVDITDDELQLADIVIINGREIDSLGNENLIIEYLKKNKNIIFTSIPDTDYITANGLKEIMGIKKIKQSRLKEGVKFLSGFMLGGLVEFPKLMYMAPEVELLPTTKTYVIDSKESSVIWRNVYGKSEIYVVNGPFFETKAGYGILSAIMAQIYPDYIYPIVNAKVFTYSGLPYFSYENTNEIDKMYNRDSMQLQQDILIPDILSINKRRNFIPSGFLTDGFKKDNTNAINRYNLMQVNNYEKDIYELGGEVGMLYTGDLDKDVNLYHDVFSNKQLKSILINDEEAQALDKLINEKQFKNIESVVGPWKVKNNNFGYITKDAVFIPFTIDGTKNTDLEKLEFYSAVTAFGAIIQNLNIEQIIFPNGDKDNWINVSHDYTNFIDSYRMNFKIIESRNITDTALLVKRFVLNSPSIKYFSNKIELRFDKWYGESYYILRTRKEIDSITGGTVEKMEEDVYLVTVKNKEINIKLSKNDKYK